jgi:ABC-type uncharacterized transport system involved in gliding motility auxiliary subunit
MADTNATLPTPTEDQRGRWPKILGILRSIAVLLAIVGGIAEAGGLLIYLWVEDLRSFAEGVLAIGAILLLVALTSSIAPVWAAVSGQRGRYAVNAVLMTLGVASIVVLVNFISFQNPWRNDTTFTRQFSLAPQTMSILENLKEPVQAVAFFTPANTLEEAELRQRAEDLLSEFQRRSSRQFTYEFLDPDANPGRAAQYGVTQYPVIVLETPETGRLFPLSVPPLFEQDLTSSLLIITEEKAKFIYFLAGHGEKDPTDQDPESTTGYGFALEGLFTDSYVSAPLALGAEGTIPDGQDNRPAAAVLVVASPQGNLLENEQKEILRWMKASGRILFLLDPESSEGPRDLLKNWGITVGQESVVDLGRSVHQAPRVPLLQRNQYGDTTPITNQLDVSFFPNAAPVSLPLEFIKDPRLQPPWISYHPLAASTAASFATADPKRNEYDVNEDLRGPHILAMAVQACSPVEEETKEILIATGTSSRCISAEGERPPTSIVIIGDSDFANNRNFYAYTNADLFLNSVNWLAEDFDLISIRPKPFVFRELVLTTGEFNFIRYSSWFLLPAAVALGGIAAWWRRR